VRDLHRHRGYCVTGAYIIVALDLVMLAWVIIAGVT
jgi:hypothetical protein